MKCPTDYRLWRQTMYCHFGQKWAKLHHGPMWSAVRTNQQKDYSRGYERDPIQVC